MNFRMWHFQEEYIQVKITGKRNLDRPAEFAEMIK